MNSCSECIGREHLMLQSILLRHAAGSVALNLEALPVGGR